MKRIGKRGGTSWEGEANRNSTLEPKWPHAQAKVCVMENELNESSHASNTQSTISHQKRWVRKSMQLFINACLATCYLSSMMNRSNWPNWNPGNLKPPTRPTALRLEPKND